MGEIPSDIRVRAHRLCQELAKRKALAPKEERALKILEAIAYSQIGKIPVNESLLQETPKDSFRSGNPVSPETEKLERKAGIFHGEKVVEILEKNPKLRKLLGKV